MRARKGDARPTSRARGAQRTGKVGLGLLALFVCGLLAAGALAGSGSLGDPTPSTDMETTSTESGTTETTPTEPPPPPPPPPPAPPAPPAPTAPYIVTFDLGVSDAAARTVIADAGGTVDSSLAVLSMYFVSLTADGASAVAADSRVARVEADRSREVAGTPNDPEYGSQWALPRIGWDLVYGEVAPAAQAEVAVLDTGIDASSPELDGNVVAGTSFVSGSPWNADPNGHGTSMAGIVAAETNNGAGVAGVGYAGVKVMPVTVLGADGTGQDSDVIQGVVWATQHGADVILMSFSNPGYSPSLQAAIDYAWSQGVVLVAAAGNDGSSAPQFPAGDRGVMGVANTDALDGLAGSSNYGQAVFIAAPGQGIATVNGSVSGTSASAAVVAGAAALIKASSVGASNGVIVSRLARSADPAGTTAQTGNGRVNLARAIADTSNESLQPAGAAPVGGGGPIVGPYVIAGNGDINGVIRDSVTGALLSGATVSATCSGCNGTPSVSYAGGGSSTNATGAYSVAFNYPGNGPATITVTAAKAGYTAGAGSSATITCTNNGTCTGSPFTRNLTLTAVLRATATTVTCTPATVALNQGSTCNAVVDDTAAGTTSNPTGTVTFSRAGTGTGSFTPATTCTLANVPSDPDSSQCSVTYTPTTGVNVHTISASYGGASPHAASTDPDGFALTVTLRSTSTEVLCSPSSMAFGQASTCTATLSDTDGGTKSFPTGTVTFGAAPAASGAFSSPGTSCSLVQVGATTTSSCSVSYTPSANPGTHTITGSYGGSSTHAASSDGFDLTVTKRMTATTVTCAPASVAVNVGTVCTATVDDTDSGTKSSPAGSVDFTRSGAGSGNFSSASCTLSPTDAESSSCQVGYRPTSGAGAHTVNGAYQGSATHATSNDDFALTVTLRTTDTTVTCSPAAVSVNEGTACTAVVDDTDGGLTSNPSGTVDFTRSGAGSGTFSSASCTLAPVPSDPDSSSCQVGYRATAGAGTHTVEADYQGSSTHDTSGDDFDVTVTLRETQATVTCSPASVAIDEGTACTAVVDDVDGGLKSNPAGTVGFSSSDTGSFSSASCTLAPVPSDPDSSSCQVGYRPTANAGTHTITGTYGGSTTHAADSDTFDLTVTLRETETTVTCSPASVAINEGTVCVATVDDVDGGLNSSPAGSVSFSSDETGNFNGASCTLAATDADSSSCQVGYRPTANAGTHTITGTYSGSSKHDTSSDTFALTVTKRDTTTTVECAPASVALDQGTVCTATVDDADGGQKSSPAGSVDFSHTGGSGNFSSPSCTLAASDADSSSCQVGYRPTANAGTHTITGSYGGSATHATSSGGFGLTVTLRDTATTVTCVPGSVVVNQATTCTATVGDESPGSKSAPAGTVSFSSSGAGAFSSPGTSCTLTPATTSSSCSVTYTPSNAVAPTHTITGSYGGSAKHDTSTGTFGVSVSKRATTTTIACAPPVQQIGQNMTCTATVKDVDANGTKSPPQGTVTFSKAVGDSGSFPSPGATCTLNAAVVTGDTNTCTVQYTSPVATVDALSAQYNGSTVHETSATDPLSPLLVVFYDPNGGFVTGGGWINSPAGAYRADITLTGKANFGFVSKYKKGQSTPTGQTEFQFHAGGLNFHSEAYQWLVVSANNTKAQYKGTGDVNGETGYGFMITAYDGNPDRFRIKIWKLSDSSIVYDNNFGSSDDIDTVPMQIANGSIVIHK